MIVGERLQELRKGKGLSQKELAAILGIKPKTLSAYEREVANPSDEIKVKIAKYFNISLDYLMGLTRIEMPLDRKGYIQLPVNAPVEYVNEIRHFMELAKHKYGLK